MRKVKKNLAFLLALTLIMSMLGKDRLFVAAEEQTIETESAEETVTSSSDVVPEKEEESFLDESAEEDTAEADEVGKGTDTSEDENDQESADEAAADEESEPDETEEAGSTEVTEETGEETTEETEETTEETEETTEEATETIEKESKDAAAHKGSEDDPWEAKAYMPGMKSTITVKAYAEKGVLPEDAEMKVEMLKESSSAYQEAKELVEESGKEFDGMMALDIGFVVDEDGKSIKTEPDGDVRIVMELPEIIPAEVDEDSLEINHITEDKHGNLKAVAVADSGNKTEGVVEIVNTDSEETQDAKAEFVTDGFSVYTITWNVGSLLVTRKINIDLQAATRTSGDSEFEVLFGKTSVGSLELGADQDTVSFPLHEGVDNVTYNNKTYVPTGQAYIKAGNGYAEVESIKLKTVRSDYRDYYVVYAEGEGLTEPDSRDFKTNSSVLFYGNVGWSGWNDSRTPHTVYLEYNTPLDPSGPTGGGTQDTDVDSLAHRKYIEDNEDGTYDLTLTVSGAAGSSESKKQLDVLLILDQSGSMKYDMRGNENASYGNSRWYNAKKAINELISSLENNTALDTRYSIVTFSGSKSNRDEKENDAWCKLDWARADDFTLSGALNPGETTGYGAGGGVLDFEPNGGTNYQAGLRKGIEQLNSARDTAQKVVIFLSDGEATYYYNENGITVGAGTADADSVDRWGTNNSGSCSRAAYAEAERIKNADFFYTIGLGNADKINAGVLRELSARVKTGSPDCVTNENNEPFMCDNLAGLTAAFEKMVGDITRFTCSNVTITDELSENVNIIGAQGAPEEVADSDFTIRVTNEKGESVEVPDGITAHYDAEERQVVLDFPDSYELESGYTYSVTFKVIPSDEAYQKYAQNGDYTDTAGADTGDHAGEKGFFSNNSATVTYTYKGERKEEFYQNPVVLVELGKVTISKKADGLPEEYANKDYSFTIQGPEDISDYSKYLLKGSSGSVAGNVLTLKSGESATFVYKKGTNLTFKENEAGVEGFDWTVSANDDPLTKEQGYAVTGALTEDGTSIVVANSYTPANRTLTVKKLVDGNMGNRDEDFEFKLKLTKNNEEYKVAIAYVKYDEANDNSSGNMVESGNLVFDTEAKCYKFFLQHNQHIDLTLPSGCVYTVSEDQQNYDVEITAGGNKISGKTVNGTIEDDTTVIFTNILEVVTPPTGVMRDASPYLSMVLTAFAAALWFVLIRRRKA